MKTFFRILKYSDGLAFKLVQFFTFSFIGIIFSALSLVAVIPLLNVLFDKVESQSIPPLPAFDASPAYVIGVFKHHFITVITEYGKAEALMFVCLCVVLSVMTGNLFRYFERIVASKIRIEIVRNLRITIFKNVTLLHIGFFNNQRKGDLISRFTNDVQEVESAVMNSLKAVLREPITFVIYFSLLFTISAKLTLFTLIVLPIVGGMLSEIVRRLKKQAKSSQESLGRIVNILDETFSGMRVVKAFNARNFIIKKMEDENKYYGKVSMSMAYKNELASPTSEFLGVLVVAVIIYYGGNKILSGGEGLEAGAFIGFLTIFASIIQPAKAFSNGLTLLQKGIASAR
jgi:subfamily B ATP-binding cassette protein MsbA